MAQSVTVTSFINDCTPCLIDGPCYHLVPCDPDSACTIQYGLSFDFSTYVDQFVTINDDPCVYIPKLSRQAFFNQPVILSQLSDPGSDFQLGTDDHTYTINSLIYDGIEYITSPIVFVLTPLNIIYYECADLVCTEVTYQTTENTFANWVNLLNSTFVDLGVPLEAHTNEPSTAPVDEITDHFIISYEETSEFSIDLQVDSNLGTTNHLFSVALGGNTTYILNGVPSLSVANSIGYCFYSGPVITNVSLLTECTPSTFPPSTAEECITRPVFPNWAVPGISDLKCYVNTNCDFSESVYARYLQDSFGVNYCCAYNYDKIILKKRLLDLDLITLDYNCEPIEEDLCPPDEVVAAACPEPSLISAILDVPPLCPPPSDASAVLTPTNPTPAVCSEFNCNSFLFRNVNLAGGPASVNYLKTNATYDINTEEELTISFSWFRQISEPMVLVGTRASTLGSDSPGMDISFANNFGIQFYLEDSAANVLNIRTANFSASASGWNHIMIIKKGAAVINAFNTEIYINNVLAPHTITSNDTLLSEDIQGGPIFLGNSQTNLNDSLFGPSRSADAYIDEFSMFAEAGFPNALDATQRAAIFNNHDPQDLDTLFPQNTPGVPYRSIWLRADGDSAGIDGVSDRNNAPLTEQFATLTGATIQQEVPNFP